MYQNEQIGVVITAYNEEGFVGEVIEGVPDFVDRVYVIDDCSTDGTWDEILEHVEHTDNQLIGETYADGGLTLDQRIIPIRHGENKGVGGAIKTGFREAHQDGNDIVAVMNGDGQMDPDILDRIITPIADGDADYVKGNRLTSSSDLEEMSRWRLFGNIVLTFLTKISSGYWKVMDPQNGYVAISRSAIDQIDLTEVYDRYGFLNDMLIRLNVHQMKVADVRMRSVYRDETSHIRYSTFIPSVSTLLLRGFFWRLKERYLIRDFHPVVFFYTLGAIGASIGVITILMSVWILVDNGLALVGGLLSVLFFLLSSVIFMLGIIYDMEENMDLEMQYMSVDTPTDYSHD